MTDDSGAGPVPGGEDDADHKKMMDELFGDPEDEGDPETPESIRAERDELLEKVASMAARLNKSQQDNLTLTKQIAAMKEESAAAAARTLRQVDQQKETALAGFLKDVLPVVDNLERGLGAISPDLRAADPKFDKLAQGVEKTLSQLTAVFNKNGIREINPKGETFDPSRHEAIATGDDPGAESDTVLEVSQKGYELNGRVIRAAKVIVKP